MILKDSMTPLERGKALAEGKEVDRLPCNPNLANGVALIHGCKISEFNSNAKTLADAQIAAYRRFGYDGIRIFTDLFTWAEAMGAKVICPENNTVDLAKPAISDISEISRIQPADPYKDGRLPVHLEAMKYLVEGVGNEVGCSAGVVGPFTNAFFLIGVDNALKLIRKNPEVIHKLCEISLETCMRYAEAAINIGLTPTISEPMSSCTVVSPKDFREFSLPYLKRLVDFIKSRGKGVVIHICGQTKNIWEDVVNMGINGFSIDNVANLKECCNTIGDRARILGHIDPGGVMYGGTPEEVRQKTLEDILDAYNSPKGYTVMSGCSLPIKTPFENIDAMMNTVREVGYPVNEEKIRKLLSLEALAR